MIALRYEGAHQSEYSSKLKKAVRNSETKNSVVGVVQKIHASVGYIENGIDIYIILVPSPAIIGRAKAPSAQSCGRTRNISYLPRVW